MGGYGAYIWPAYGVAAFVMIGLVLATLRTLRTREADLARLEADREQWGQKGDASPDRTDPS